MAKAVKAEGEYWKQKRAEHASELIAWNARLKAEGQKVYVAGSDKKDQKRRQRMTRRHSSS